MAADPALVEGSDPDRLPQHRLLRERRVRHPPGRPNLLPRQERGRADASRGGPPRRDPPEPDALRPGAPPHGRTRPTIVRARPAVPAGAHQPGGAAAGERRAHAEARGRPAPRHARPGAVLRRLRHRPARRPLRGRAGLRRWSRGDDDDRPRPPGQGARGDPEGARRPGRPGGGARRDRPANGRRTRDVRRHELPAEPVQPRDAGGAAAGLVVQADRARERIPTGDRAVDAPDLEADRDRCRRPHLEGLELRGLLPRRDRPRPRHGRVGQLGVRAAHEDRRSRRRSSTRRGGSASAPSCPRTSRSASAPLPSTRST